MLIEAVLKQGRGKEFPRTPIFFLSVGAGLPGPTAQSPEVIDLRRTRSSGSRTDKKKQGSGEFLPRPCSDLPG